MKSDQFQIVVFWVVTLGSQIIGYESFGGICRFHLQSRWKDGGTIFFQYADNHVLICTLSKLKSDHLHLHLHETSNIAWETGVGTDGRISIFLHAFTLWVRCKRLSIICSLYALVAKILRLSLQFVHEVRRYSHYMFA
jgi:hypothetical protein